VRTLLAPWVVDEANAPPNYSLLLAEPSSSGRIYFHTLYRGGQLVSRSTDPSRVVRALLTELDVFTDRDNHYLRLTMSGLLREDGAVLVPLALRQLLLPVQRKLNSGGATLLDGPVVYISPAAELVLPEAFVSLDPEMERELWSIGGGRADRQIEPNTYAVAGWALFATRDPLTAGRTIAIALRQVLNLEQLGVQEALDILAAAVRGRHLIGLGAANGRQLAETLTRSP